jgi:pimeloyl-ACP methyl ester carboxylesterase
MINRTLISLLLLSSAQASATQVAETVPVRSGAVDTLVRVNGHELHLVLRRGHVPITVVLEAGGASNLTSWGEVPQRIATATGATVVAYDRAGLGGSGLPLVQLTPAQEVQNLNFALHQLAVPKNTVLVATSYGALLSLLNAAEFPEEVVGLVLVDPMNPGFVRATGDFVFTTVPEIANPQTNRDRVIARMVATFPSLLEEVAVVESALPQPMFVITAGDAWWRQEKVDRAWRRSHEALAAASAQRKLIVAEASDHDIAEKRPDVIVAAVEQLLAVLSGLPR